MHQYELKHKGVQTISVEIGFISDWATPWHLEGPITFDATKVDAAVHVRRLLYYALHWVGEKSKRSIDRIVSEAMEVDISVTRVLEELRSTSAIAALSQFIPNGIEFLMLLEVDAHWKDKSGEGTVAKARFKKAIEGLVIPKSARVSALTAVDPSQIGEEPASIARLESTTIVVTDLDYRWGSRSGGTTYNLRYYLKECVHWPKVEVILVHQGDTTSSAAERLKNALHEAKKIADTRLDKAEPMTFHLWLSGSFAIETYGGTTREPLQRMGKITDAEILAIIEIISIIQKDNVGHPCLVRLNSNTWEFLNLGNKIVSPSEATPGWIATFQSRLRSVGCTISQDSMFWKEVYATAAWSPYQATYYNGTFRGPGAGLQVFGVLEKHLLREKLLDAMLLQHDQMKSFRKAVIEMRWPRDGSDHQSGS